MITCVPLPAFADNYIWVLRDNGHCVVVDPGCAQPVQQYLAEQALTLDAVLITHHHADHVGGVAELRTQNPTLAVYGPRLDLTTHPVAEGDILNLPNLPCPLHVLAVPGHTADHLVYYAPDSAQLWCGDTLFVCGCGRVFDGTPTQLYASLQRLAALPAHTQVYCTHEYTLANQRFALAVEPDNHALQQRHTRDQERRARGLPTVPSTLEEEWASNPFLRCHCPTVHSSVAAWAGRPLLTAESIFIALREWKNSFR